MNNQRGFGAVEYIVGLVFFAMAILAPLPGEDGKNVVDLLVEGVKKNHASYMYAQSLSHMQVDESVIPGVSSNNNESAPLLTYEEN